MNHRDKTINMGPELLKLVRDNPMTRQQIAKALGWNIRSAEKWTKEFEAYGLLSARRAPGVVAKHLGGPVPMAYEVAPAWRGQA
jgi:hypothetical protein